MSSIKTFEYQTVVIAYSGHLTDQGFIATLNEFGAQGWKHKEEQPAGSGKLALLMEREILPGTTIGEPSAAHIKTEDDLSLAIVKLTDLLKRKGVLDDGK